MIAQKAFGRSHLVTECEPCIVPAQGPNDRGLRGDIAISDFHPIKPRTILDVRVTNADGGYQSSRSTQAILDDHEQQKWSKYHVACERKGMEFLPFVVTSDGALGKSALVVVDRLSAKLSEKWHKGKGEVRAWVRARLAVAVAKATSACIRGRRMRPLLAEALDAGFEDGAGLGLLLDCGSAGAGPARSAQ
jgi:hypothetical protein